MSVFREAQEPTKQQEAPLSKPVEQVGTPIETHAPDLLATYRDDMGKPYVAEYLGVNNVWDQDKNLQRDVEEIEGYLQEQVKSGSVDNSTKAGKEFLKNLERQAGLSRYESGAQRIQKLLAYIDFKRVVNS